MEPVLRASVIRSVEIYLPESFEWIILKSGLLKDPEIEMIIADPSAYIESREFFSWERFFNAILTEKTRDSYLAYNKKKLNPLYLREREAAQIMSTTPLEREGLQQAASDRLDNG